MLDEKFDTIMDCWSEQTDCMSQEDRVDLADAIINMVQYERRLWSLTQRQVDHMSVMEGITTAQRERIDKCKTDEAKDDVIAEYARAEYFKSCEWTDYLNNGGKPPLEDPEQL